MIDFEGSMVSAVREELQKEPLGCLFHFTKCLYRKVQNYGLTKTYRNNEIFNKQFNRIKVSHPYAVVMLTFEIVSSSSAAGADQRSDVLHRRCPSFPGKSASRQVRQLRQEDMDRTKPEASSCHGESFLCRGHANVRAVESSL